METYSHVLHTRGVSSHLRPRHRGIKQCAAGSSGTDMTGHMLEKGCFMEPFRVDARSDRSIGGICVTCDLAIWLWEEEARNCAN
jgi:hypothetical protein